MQKNYKTSLRRSYSDHSINAGRSTNAGSRHRSIASKQQTRRISLPLSIDGTEGIPSVPSIDSGNDILRLSIDICCYVLCFENYP